LGSLVFPEWSSQANKSGPLCLSFEEVPLYAGHEIAMEVENNILLIVDDLLGILGQQLRLHPLPLQNIIIFIILNHF